MTRVIEVKITISREGKVFERSASLALDGEGVLYRSEVSKMVTQIVENLLGCLSDSEVYKMVNKGEYK